MIEGNAPPTDFKKRVVEYVNSEAFFNNLKSCTLDPSTDNDRKFKMLAWMVNFVEPKLSSLDPDLNVSGNVTISFTQDTGPSNE